MLALFEETVREAGEDIGEAVEAVADPLERLRVFTIRLHEWCDPVDAPRKRGTHNRRADLGVLDATRRQPLGTGAPCPRTGLAPPPRARRRRIRGRLDPRHRHPAGERARPTDRDVQLVRSIDWPTTRGSASPPKRPGSSASAASAAETRAPRTGEPVPGPGPKTRHKPRRTSLASATALDRTGLVRGRGAEHLGHHARDGAPVRPRRDRPPRRLRPRRLRRAPRRVRTARGRRSAGRTPTDGIRRALAGAADDVERDRGHDRSGTARDRDPAGRAPAPGRPGQSGRDPRRALRWPARSRRRRGLATRGVSGRRPRLRPPRSAPRPHAGGMHGPVDRAGRAVRLTRARVRAHPHDAQASAVRRRTDLGQRPDQRAGGRAAVPLRTAVDPVG